jgi:phage repressor protein C with HTH and peptisase S24 domain
MLPNLKPGEWVLARAIDGLDQLDANKIHVVVLYDSVMVKKIEKAPMAGKINLISLNPSYPPYTIDAEQIQELWQVSSKITFGVDASNEKGLLKELQESMEELKEQLKKR